MPLPSPDADADPDRPLVASDDATADIAAHIAEERRRVSLLGEIREIVFGAQDGLVSTLAVVATVAAATNDRLAVLIAGLASALAGIFSMAAGEYLGSKSQAEIFDAEISNEREEVADRSAEAEAEASQVAAILARHPTSMLSTMVAKELGLIHTERSDPHGGPLRGALIMGGVFAAGGFIPILPFLISGGIAALLWAATLTGTALFGLGAIKSRWTHRSWLTSGAEVFSLAAFAGIAGYLFGSVLPGLLGFASS